MFIELLLRFEDAVAGRIPCRSGGGCASDQYILRCRLKTVEESFKGSGLIRCNRKYIVNIKKVAMLRKESEGYVLDLGNENIPPLPVTKTYTDTILSYFTDESPLLEPIEE